MGGVALLVLLGVLARNAGRSPTRSGSGRRWRRRPPGCKPTMRKQVDACIVPGADGDRAPAACRLGLVAGRVPGAYDPQSGGEVQLPDESAHGGDDFYGMGPRHGPQRHCSRRDLAARGDGGQAPQGVGPLAGLRRAEARRAGVTNSPLPYPGEGQGVWATFSPRPYAGEGQGVRAIGFAARAPCTRGHGRGVSPRISDLRKPIIKPPYRVELRCRRHAWPPKRPFLLFFDGFYPRQYRS